EAFFSLGGDHDPAGQAEGHDADLGEGGGLEEELFGGRGLGIQDALLEGVDGDHAAVPTGAGGEHEVGVALHGPEAEAGLKTDVVGRHGAGHGGGGGGLGDGAVGELHLGGEGVVALARQSDVEGARDVGGHGERFNDVARLIANDDLTAGGSGRKREGDGAGCIRKDITLGGGGERGRGRRVGGGERGGREHGEGQRRREPARRTGGEGFHRGGSAGVGGGL